MKFGLILLAGVVFLILMALYPFTIPPYLDFQVLYHANTGLLRGIALYDHEGQVNMIAQFAHVPTEQVFVLPFPYPPWYALSTVWLAWLPIERAARVWFGLSLIFVFISVWLMTDGWPAIRRLVSFFFAILFLPVLGSLFVGQYGFPVLLGAALLIYALRHQKIILTTLAAALLTFKPHLGGLIVLITLVYLWRRRDVFGRRAMIAIVAAGIFLFAIGFLASPLWPLDYFHSLTGFKDVSQCHQCNSASMAIAGLLGGGLNQAVWFAAITLILLAGWLIWQWHSIAQKPEQLVSAGVLITLLVSPYLQNYDYVLLLVPLFVLARDAQRLDWLWIIVGYALPFIALGLVGANGDVSLIFVTLILFIQSTARSYSGLPLLDVS
jgi:hypothetical protein